MKFSIQRSFKHLLCIYFRLMTQLLINGVITPAIEKIKKIYRAMYEYREHKGIFGNCMALTVAGQTAFIIANYLLARSLGIEIPLAFFFFFVPILLLMGVIYDRVEMFVDISMVYALLNFLGTLVLAKYIKQSGEVECQL